MAFLGAMLGAIAHPRILKDRKVAMLSVAVINFAAYIPHACMWDVSRLSFYLH